MNLLSIQLILSSVIGTYKFEKVAAIMEALSVYNEFNNREVLELVDTWEERETLSIALALDGNMGDKFKLLYRKISK